MENATSTDSLLSAAQSAQDATTEKSLRVPCYCEENVWRLAYRRRQDTHHIYHVVFVSNKHMSVPMFFQLASVNPQQQACVWDYHVLLFQTDPTTQRTVVLDVDSSLPFPCELLEYLDSTFPKNIRQGNERYIPLFRVVEARMFIKHFSSDRTHMYNATTGEWNAPPPQYEWIQAGNIGKPTSNLKEYIHMDTPATCSNDADLDLDAIPQHPFGIIMTFAQLCESFHAT